VRQPRNDEGTVEKFTPASQLGGQDKLSSIEEISGMKGYASGTPDTLDTTLDDTYKPFQTRGLQRLERYADTTSPVDTSIMNAERERFAGKAASAGGALSQELSQAGITGRAAVTEQARLERQIGAQENEMMQSLRKGQSDKAFTAAQQLPSATATARTEDRLQEGLDFTKQQWSDTEGQRMLSDALVMGPETWLARHPGANSVDYQRARDEATLNQQTVKLSKDRFEQEQLQYSDSAKWTAYEAAVLAGDFDAAATQYKAVTGNDIDMDYMRNYQDYLIKQQQQEILSGDIAIDAQSLGVSSDRLTAFVNAVNSGADLNAANQASGLNLNPRQFAQIQRDYSMESEAKRIANERLKNQFGQETFDSMMDRINSGASLSMVNDEFDADLTSDDFMNMLSSTAFGQMQWSRSLTGANMLLQTNDPVNILTAEEMYEDLFPGARFDMHQLINDIGAERFANSMTDLATLAATFDTWEEAQTSATRMNLFDDLQMTDNDAHQLFQSLKINQIDEQWKAIEKSDFYNGLDADTRDLIQDTFSAGLSGELEFDITPVYKITDAQGRLVESFSNIEDANTFLGENADKGYLIEEGKNYVYKNITTGDTVVVNNNGEVQEDTGEGGEVTPAINDAWDYFQESMTNLPEGEKPNYNEFKIEWIKAGRPNNWGYEDYTKVREKSSENILSSLVDKYKTGWPTIDLSAGGDIIQSELELNAVKAARQSFIATPENITEITSDNANDNFKKIGIDIFNLLSNSEQNTYNSWEEYTSKNPIYLEGYDSPFIIGLYQSGISKQMTKVKSADEVQLEGIPLISLSDGKKVWLQRDGTLSTVGRPAEFY
jgi:hypothetical protein